MAGAHRLTTAMIRSELETRKIEEAESHNRLRDPDLRNRPREYARLTANKKYYAVTRTSTEFYDRWLKERCAGRRVLDYGCGDGACSCMLAEHGAFVTGIDISDISVRNSEHAARTWGLGTRATFRVMDAESMSFPSNSFDIVCETGVLHHLDLDRAMAEIARVLTPEGQAICYEAVGHNPLFQAYRRLTPHLRTAYETNHILKMEHFRRLHRYFENVEIRFHHLFALAAVPFRNSSVFRPVLGLLDRVDSVALRVPGLRLQAWVAILILSNPRKNVAG